jgi:type II secretory pathway component GspD/PulD (secretin)
MDKLDPSVVRRVTEEQLYDLKPYDFVKVAFELPPGMEVDKAKEDVKQVLNSTAKIFPLVASKRLLVMDSVANLRTVSELLNQERMVADGRIVPREFVLKNARPDKVIDILYVVLGMDPKSRPTQMDLQLQQQKLQLMTQMQQRGTDVSKMLKQDGPPVYLAFNRQRNSVLANAPPEQMKIIEQTIAYLDVPFGSVGASPTTGAAGPANDARVMKKYPLTSLDPDRFVSTLEEIGGLSPSADFKVDDDSKVMFALATESDHARINALIDQFDGSGRTFEVINLRRLPADAVAASINNLMGGQAEKEEKNSRRSYFFDYDFYGGGGRGDDSKKKIKGFGVDADIEHNRLVLWANEAEMKRVRDLLVKLGEIPSQQTARPMRIIPAGDAENTAALLEKLRAAWPTAGRNELIIKAPPEKKPAATEQEEEKKPATENPKPAAPAAKSTDRATDINLPSRIAAHFVQLNSTMPEDNSSAPAAAPPATSPTPAGTQPTAPPITITVTDDGRLLLSSPDSAALDRMEELIDELTPPDKRFKIFPIKYVRASEIWYDLTDYFKEDINSDTETNYDYSWYPPRPRSSKAKSEVSLSKRRKLMLTYDRPSNSILVANASSAQLAEMQQLIEQFDKPTAADSVEIRQTAAIKILYSRPSVIAAAVKEVYRDLLSKRDKEFDKADKRDERSTSERTTVINYGGSGDSDKNDRPSPVKIGFDGALSLGADDVSGVLIVSAQKALFADIVRMIHELDNEAAPKTTVAVHHVNGNVSAKSLQAAIDKAVGKAWLGSRPEQQPSQTGPEGEKKRGDKKGNERGERQNDGNNND